MSSRPTPRTADLRLKSRSFASFCAEVSPSADREQGQAQPPWDVVIVGSGYGGSMAAYTLAHAKRDGAPPPQVLVLERGKAWQPGEFPSRVGDLPRALRFVGADGNAVANPEGLFDLRLGTDVTALVANGVGGGSLINAGVMLEPDPAEVASAPLAERIKALQACGVYTRAKRLLGGEVFRQGQWVRNNADRWVDSSLPSDPASPLRKLAAFRRHAVGQAVTAEALDITVGLDGGPNSAGVKLSACNGCGDCMTGCNVGAKDTLDRNLLLSAQQAGTLDLQVVTGASVVSLRRTGTGQTACWLVRVVHTDERLQVREERSFGIRAKRVVLAAGTLGSTEILLRSRSDELVFSPALGESFSGNGDQIAAMHRLAEAMHCAADEDQPSDERQIGPTITAGVALEPKEGKRFWVQDFSVPGAMRHLFDEAVTTGAAMARMAHGDWQDHHSEDRDPLAVNPEAMERTLLVGVIGHDDARGCLRMAQAERIRGELPPVGTLRIHWPEARWGRQMDWAHDRLSQFTVGAAKTARSADAPMLVANPAWRLLPDAMASLVSQPRGPVLTVHPLGGCRMGPRLGPTQQQGVVDEAGRVYDLGSGAGEGPSWFGSLVVLDGAIVGASLGANPALTIAALALGAMEALLQGDRHWEALGHPQPDLSTLPSSVGRAAHEAPITIWPRPTKPAPTPKRTELDIAERLSGEVQLLDRPPMVAELTLYYQRTSAATLVAPERVPVPVDATRSRLRLYDAAKWHELQLQHHDDTTRTPLALYEGEMAGSLRFLHHEPSGGWQRMWRALFCAYLPNRGLRDLWHRFIRGYLTERGRKEREALRLSRPPKPEPIWPKRVIDSIREFLDLGSHAGQARRFDYELILGTVLLDKVGLTAHLRPGARIAGHKLLTYNRRGNPWKQLTELMVTQMPGQRTGQQPVLTLDLRHLAQLGQPLLSIGSQRNQVEAMVEVGKLGLYVLRVLIAGHLWSFRKPDAEVAPREVNRLPRGLAGMPEPDVTTLAVGTWPQGSIREGLPVTIRLTRYPQAYRATGGPPVVMIHGYSASGTTFAHPSLPTSAAEWFWRQGRDVWVLDLRTSSALDSALLPWSMEQVALVDIPAALTHVRNSTGQRVDVIAHCIGGSMLAMALLSDAQSVRDDSLQLGSSDWLTREQLGVLVAFNGEAPSPGGHPTVRSVVLSQKGPVMRYTDANVLRAFLMSYARRYVLGEHYSFQRSANPGVAEELMDRLLASLPYKDEDFDRENPMTPWALTPWSATRHRLDAMFGRLFSSCNLRDDTLAAIDDFFGPINMDTVAQTIHYARWDCITNQRGRGEFLTRQRIGQRWGQIPTLALHSADNAMVSPFTLKLVEANLGEQGVPLKTVKLPRMEHQDSLIGKDAAQTFEIIERFLNDLPSPHAAVRTAPACVAFEPWLGPRLVMPDAQHPQVRVAIKLRPDQGQGRLWLVPVVATAVGSARPFDLIGAQSLWTCGQLGDNEQWLFAVPQWPAPVEKGTEPNPELAGWLAVAVYAFAETRPIASDLLDSAHLDLDHTPPTRLTPDLVLTDPHAPVRAAVEAWLGRQPATVLRACLVRADDIARCAQAPSTKPLRFALASCRYPHSLLDRAVAGQSLDRLADKAGNLGFALMVGDQIYADATAGLADPTRSDETFDQPHQRAFHEASMRRVMQRLPVQMLLDDHEIFDNWQPMPTTPGTGGPQASALRRLGPRHSALVSRTQKALANGLASFWRFQRMVSKDLAWAHAKKRTSIDLAFDAGGHAFYLLDNRTRRQRGRPSDRIGGGQIIDAGQRQELESWLIAHERQVKFVATPSLFLPRRKETAEDARNASRVDGWDGFPDSMRWLLDVVIEHKVHDLVLLSGDEHHSLVSEAWVGPGRIKVVSVHSSALYAPFPFANGRPAELAPEDPGADLDGRVQSLVTTFAPPGDGFATLELKAEAGAQVLLVWHHKADGAGSIERRVTLR